MHRRTLLKLGGASLLSHLSACGYLRIDPWHYRIRSARITSEAEEKRILQGARTAWTSDKRIRVLFVSGSPYERGYQHGVLLREEVNDNLNYIYETALEKFHFQELFAEIYERMRPFIPQEYIEEMHGLAHGARMPLHVIHHMHILPSVGEWGGKKAIKKVLKAMMRGELGTSCSNVGVSNSATADGELYAVRILDWGLHRISKLHEYPLITVGIGESGYAYCNIGWVGFLGAVSGMNEMGITLGEMGYGDPPNEKLEGQPMPFLLRDVLSQAKNLADVRRLIQDAEPTASFGYLMTDGKSKEAELYVRDPDRFLVFTPGTDLRDADEYFPAREDISYGGHYEEVMAELLRAHRGNLSPELFMKELIPKMAMKSNFQNVVYAPSQLRFWVNNAVGPQADAKRQPYSLFEFGKELESFRSSLKAQK